MDKVYQEILVVLKQTASKWESLDFNIKLGIVMIIIVIVFGGLYIIVVHLETSNTGKPLWNSRSYKYIDIKPKEDYMSIIKQENNNSNSKNIVIDNQPITISYTTEPGAQEIIDEIGIHKLIDPIKLAEYCTKKVNSILFSKPVYNDINLVFKKTTKNDYAGANFNAQGNVIVFNFTFIKNMYENTSKEDFITYYVGLYMHELVHSFIGAKTLEKQIKTQKLVENIAEYVRMVSGFQPSTWKLVYSNKELPTEKYGAEGAYFLYWIENNYPGFVKRIVEDNYSSQENEYYQEHTGKSLKELWKEFQKVLYVL